MPYRRNSLEEDKIYHVFTRSIDGSKIFNSKKDFSRMWNAMLFYLIDQSIRKFSYCLRVKKRLDVAEFIEKHKSKKRVEIVAYCFMPTHIHLVVKQLGKDSVSRYIGLLLQSYSKYFNLKYNRKGPLWDGRFKNVLVETDAQFCHLTRYVHLNPVTACLIDKPQDWEFSSYREYLGLVDESKRLCSFSDYLDMNKDEYKEFVNDQIMYQREIALIKDLVLE
ncbi:MAG: transposase [Candidatus Omnitrophota bacterium]|nr:transposase [Candidatus Omnitrophota bacterium]